MKPIKVKINFYELSKVPIVANRKINQLEVYVEIDDNLIVRNEPIEEFNNIPLEYWFDKVINEWNDNWNCDYKYEIVEIFN